MSKSLFSPAEVQLEKLAFNVRLDEDSSSWPSGILKEAYKQLPYLHKYEADIDLDRVDESRGYAVGKMIVYPARMKKHAASTEGKLVSFPVIVRGRELAPFDVYNYKESMYPENEDSVNEVLFRPGAFEGSAPTGSFGDVDLQRQMTPPRGTNRSNGGGISKMSSASLWATALPTFSMGDIEDFKSDLREDTPLRNAFLTSDSLKTRVADLVKHAEQGGWSAPPTSIQLTRSGAGYSVKVANHKAYSPTSSTVSRFEAQDMLSDNHMQELLDMGHLTVTIDPVFSEVSKEKVAQEANRVGVYTTYSGGKEVTGVVVPRMVSLSGDRNADAQVFFGATSHSIQEKVAGVFQQDVVLSGEEPRGPGSFVYQEGAMGYATEPVEILNKFAVTYGDEKIASYSGRSLYTGRPLTITIVPGLKKVAFTGSQDVSIPDNFCFVPLNGNQVGVSTSPGTATALYMKKTAGGSTVELVSDGSSFSIRGPMASVFSGDIMGPVDTEFALSSLGLPKEQIKETMKIASDSGSVSLPKVRSVVSMDTFLAQVESSKVDVSSLKANLTKEASVIADKETVDAILSLRFVTPENVGVYVNYIPELEKVSSKLAELLVASRLGMDEVRETAAKNAMSQVTSVVRGLETLRAQTQ